MEPKRKRWSPYTLKTLKRTKVNGVEIWLKSYQTKAKNRQGFAQEVTVFYYLVCASDNSSRKVMQYEEALTRFAQLVEFEKRQTEIR